MGSTLSVTVGYGIALPWGEDDEFDFTTNPFYKEFFESDEPQEWERPDTWEILEAVCTRFPLLGFDVANYSDYTAGAALLLKGIGGTAYDATVAGFDPSVYISSEQVNQLREAAELLGVTYVPQWLVVTYYG